MVTTRGVVAQMLNFRYGPIASLLPSADYFRSSPGNGHRQGRSPCLKGANNGLMHCSKTLFFRLRFRGDGRRQRAMIGTSSPAKRRMSGRTVANLLTNLALDPFGQIPDKFCAVRAKLVGIRTAAEQAAAGINPPDRCQLAKGVCGAILFCAMMASARARFSSRRWLVKTRK
jgi:hypothetical protein